MASSDTPVAPTQATPPATSSAAPTILQVMTLPPAPHVPPEPNATPPGGKFGIRETSYVDGKMIETILYVNAHGRPYSDDPDANLKDK